MVQDGNGTSSTSSRRRRVRWRCYYVFLAVALIYILLCGVIATASKHKATSKLVQEREWISSSRFWIDRQLCRFIGCCGTFHMLNHAGWTWLDQQPGTPSQDFSKFWYSGAEDPDEWSDKERARREIPGYVFEHAPYVHLYSLEEYWPSDIAEHLVHVTPFINHTEAIMLDFTPDLSNLADLNQYEDVYLHSDDNVETVPDWLRSDYNIPPAIAQSGRVWRDDTLAVSDTSQTTSSSGRCGGSENTTCAGSARCCSIWGWCGSDEDHCAGNCDPLFGTCYGPSKPGKHGPHIDLKKRALPVGGRSDAPVILVVVPKDDGIVDAFWFFFYSYNQGKKVLDIRFGNHVGDWEHTMIRFKHGVPHEVFLSAHSWGAAFAFDALEKYVTPPEADFLLSSWRNGSTPQADFKRPVVYSADGSHAMYPTPDYHAYVAPFGILHDDTDRGPLWDPTLNVKSFMYDYKNDITRSSTLNPHAPTSWFDFDGHWGDRYYLLSDPRQYRFAGEYHYNNGPLGPKFKNLGREHACINPGVCTVTEALDENLAYDEPMHLLDLLDRDAEDGD